MSRTISASAEDALEKKVHHQRARLTTYKSRSFFEADDLVDNAPDFAHPIAEDGQFIPEAIGFAGSKVVTVSVDAEGNLWLMRTDSNVAIQPEITGDPIVADPNSRPGIFGNAVFYRFDDGITPEWRRFVFDESDLIAGNPDCVTASGGFSTFIAPGAIYPTGVNDAVLCYIKDGGIAISISLAGQDGIDCPSRWINPTYPYDSSLATDTYVTHFGGAAENDDAIFFYFSHYDGSISGVKFSNNTYSDLFTAIPSDLSISKVGNVFSWNGNIFMCYRFERTEEFTSAVKYTMFSKTVDGFTFTMDLRTLVSVLDYRFLAGFDSDELNIVFSTTNRSYTTEAPYQVVGESAPSIVTKAYEVSGSTSEFTAKLKAGWEEYLDNPYLHVAAYAKLELGVQAEVGDENGISFVKYHDVVIAGVAKEFTDGGREHTLRLVPDGAWHTGQMTHPMYMEVQGKQGIYDPAQKLENLYKFSGNNGVKWTLSSDLWNADGVTAFSSQGHAGGESDDFWGPDLLTLLEEYPLFGDASDYEMRLYGWSRAGLPDTNPNTSDATPTSTDNDDFYGLVEVEDENGNVSTIVTTTGELDSTYKHPIQTYFDANVQAGSEPVVYNLTNPGEGKKIKRLGIRVISPTGNTTFGLERVEMPEINAIYKQESITADQNWNVVDVNSNWPLVDTLTLQVTSGNATNGNEVEMSYSPKAGHLYSIAVVGDVEFRRNSIDYIQDAHFVAQIPIGASPYAAPTWDRTYPPGTGPTANAACVIKFSEWPYYTNAVLTKTDVLPGVGSPNNGHAYMLHWSDSRMADSMLSSGYIPYFYSDGTKIKVQFHLAGSGAISNIVRGEFKIYIFESPEVVEDMDFYGGEVPPGTTQPFRIMNAAGTWADPYFTPGLDYYTFIASNNLVVGNQGTNSEDTLSIRNNTASPAKYRVKMKYIGVVSAPGFVTTVNIVFNWGGLASAGGTIANHASGTFEFTKTITIPANSTRAMDVHMNGFASWMSAEFREWSVAIAGEPENNQLPSPPPFDVTIPELGITLGEEEYGAHLAASRKGVPQIMFSNRPYSAFNFETTGRFRLKGEYSHAGLIGLASDENNFMLGYMRPGYAGIARVRGGVREDLFEDAVPDAEENKMLDIRFWHRDGIFGIEVKRSQDFWPQRGSQFLYEWNGDTDGAIAAEDDIYHVGVYALIDPPKFRTTGFRGSQSIIAAQPLDLDPDSNLSGLSSFPSSGQVDIGGKIYNYAGKNESVLVPRGPFHLRNQGLWASQYNKDRLGYSYPDVKSVEFLMFRWWDGATHAEDYEDMIVASSEGYAWLNQKTLWRVWITTGGALVWLRNRARFYSENIPEYYSTDAEKIWLTNGLLNVSAVVAEELEYSHPVGCFAFIHSEDEVAMFGFTGFSGELDYSVADLLEKFCLISGTQADFYGDVVISGSTLNDGEEVELE